MTKRPQSITCPGCKKPITEVGFTSHDTAYSTQRFVIQGPDDYAFPASENEFDFSDERGTWSARCGGCGEELDHDDQNAIFDVIFMGTDWSRPDDDDQEEEEDAENGG
jgi:hypothetical protein